MPMRFPYLKAARVKLQERKNACVRASYQYGAEYVTSLLEFMRGDPVIRSIITELTTVAIQKFPTADHLITRSPPRIKLPINEQDRAAFQLRFLEVLRDSDESRFDFGYYFGIGCNSYQETWSDYCSQILIPLCSYVDERIDDGDLLLYTLSRYQRDCTWFQHDCLTALLSKADPSKVENVLDQHLRSWLFREGIDFPFSAPNAPSGRPDVVIWQGEEPLPLEVKVYDGANRDVAHVSQGLWQAHRYAENYGKPFGYLVAFNTSNHLLTFDGNKGGDGPPCVAVGDVNVFAIVVDISADRESASKERPRLTKVVKAPGAAPTISEKTDD